VELTVLELQNKQGVVCCLLLFQVLCLTRTSQRGIVYFGNTGYLDYSTPDLGVSVAFPKTIQRDLRAVAVLILPNMHIEAGGTAVMLVSAYTD
jgi:hypothetical protein